MRISPQPHRFMVTSNMRIISFYYQEYKSTPRFFFFFLVQSDQHMASFFRTCQQTLQWNNKPDLRRRRESPGSPSGPLSFPGRQAHPSPLRAIGCFNLDFVKQKVFFQRLRRAPPFDVRPLRPDRPHNSEVFAPTARRVDLQRNVPLAERARAPLRSRRAKVPLSNRTDGPTE